MSLPPFCVKCGENVEGAKIRNRSLTYTPPWVYILVLVNLLVAAIVGTCVQKKLKIHFQECSVCRGRRHLLILLALVGWLGGFALLLSAIIEESALLAILGVVILAVGIVMTVLAMFPLSVTGWADGYFTVKVRSKGLRQKLQDIYKP